MPSRPVSFRENDIKRAVKATLATGLTVTRIEVEGGKLVIHTGAGEVQETPLETWRRKRGQG